MPIDGVTYREIMSAFPSGVAVVTTSDAAGAPRGLTATAVASVSTDPPLLLVCVDLESRTLPALRQSSRFVVNFMRQGREELCRLFASKAEEKFANVTWSPTGGGLPFLHEDALAWAECITEQEVPAGDHVVLMGLVVDGEAPAPDDVPLMYYRRTWGVWTPESD